MELVGLFSGGKDSRVACRIANVKEVLYCRTGVGLNEEYVKEVCKQENWKLNIVEPKENETYEEFIKKYGFPHSGIHSAIMGCLKLHPMRKWYYQQKKIGRNIVFVSGRRKKESARRMKMKSNKRVVKLDGMTFISPIHDWTTYDVWQYIKDNNLSRSPIYDTMHMSGDCLCGAFSHMGEAVALNMFHPEFAKKIIELEQKYGGKWGNQQSMTNAKNQGKLDDFICSECQI